MHVLAIFSIAVSFWLMWALQIFLARSAGIEWDIGRAGQWGDTFGALNALFGAFGFVAVIYTLRLQRNTSISQQIDSYKQQFDGHYFQLLGLVRELRGEVSVHGPVGSHGQILGKELLGRDAITRYADDLHGKIKEGTVDLTDKQALANLYIHCVRQRGESGLGPYFRVVYTILHGTLTDKILSEDERVRYGNLLRSQFTSSDLILMGLNGLTANSGDFSHYLTEFRMLKYLPDGPVRAALMLHYPSKAFSPRD